MPTAAAFLTAGTDGRRRPADALLSPTIVVRCPLCQQSMRGEGRRSWDDMPRRIRRRGNSARGGGTTQTSTRCGVSTGNAARKARPWHEQRHVALAPLALPHWLAGLLSKRQLAGLGSSVPHSTTAPETPPHARCPPRRPQGYERLNNQFPVSHIRCKLETCKYRGAMLQGKEKFATTNKGRFSWQNTGRLGVLRWTRHGHRKEGAAPGPGNRKGGAGEAA
jgi:hypothetical protein